MTQEEALRMALEALEFVNQTGDTQTFDMCYAKPALAALKEALAHPEQEPVAGEWIVLSESVGKLKELGWNDDAIHKANTPQRTWVGLMRGVRVEGDTLVITVKGGKDAARELCGALIEEMNK